jgi:hypothetical protein
MIADSLEEGLMECQGSRQKAPSKVDAVLALDMCSRRPQGDHMQAAALSQAHLSSCFKSGHNIVSPRVRKKVSYTRELAAVTQPGTAVQVARAVQMQL